MVPGPSEVTISSWCNTGETSTCGNVSISLSDQDPDSFDDSYDDFYGMNRTELTQIRSVTVFTVRPFRCLGESIVE